MIGVMLVVLTISGTAYGDGGLKFKATLSGAQEVTNLPGGVIPRRRGGFEQSLIKYSRRWR